MTTAIYRCNWSHIKNQLNQPKKEILCAKRRKPRTKKRNRRKSNAEKNELVAKMVIKHSKKCTDCKRPVCDIRIQKKNSHLNVLMSSWDFPTTMLQLTVLRHFGLPYDIVYHIMQMVSTTNRVIRSNGSEFHKRCLKRRTRRFHGCRCRSCCMP